MKKELLLLMIFCSVLNGAQPPSKQTSAPIIITKQSLANYRADIDLFLQKKKREKELLFSLPDANTFFGMATQFFIETCIAPIFSRYGEIHLADAKKFLGRTFEDETKLRNALNNLENDEDNLAYLHTIFSTIDPAALSKKDGIAFIEIVRKTRHTKIKNPKQMGDKKATGEYSITHDAFYNYSACTLMAFHIFENHNPPKKHGKKKVKSRKSIVLIS